MLAQRSHVGVFLAKRLRIDPAKWRQRHLERGRADGDGRHLLEEPQPLAHVRASDRIVRTETRRRIYFIEIFADHAGVADDSAIVNECRYDAVRVECQIAGRQVFVLAQVYKPADEFEPFLGEAKPDFLAARGGIGMVKLKHRNNL